MKHHEINSFTCDLQMLRVIEVSQQENKTKGKFPERSSHSLFTHTV